MEKAKYFGYVRVSTHSQDILKQENAVLSYAQRHGIMLTKVISEECSGTVKYTDRSLGSLLAEMKRGDTLLVTELSRLSRRTIEAITIASNLLENGINIILVNSDTTIKDDALGKIYLTVFSLVAELERNAISERTKSALQVVKASGKKLGRPKKSYSKSKLDGHFYEIDEFLRKGVSKASICKIYGVSRTCLDHFIETRIKPKEVSILSENE